MIVQSKGLRSADFGGKITHSPTCVYDAAWCTA